MAGILAAEQRAVTVARVGDEEDAVQRRTRWSGT